MDAHTAEIRYKQWAEVIRECSSSGKSKREYCREKGIDEKQFYYYQRRIRAIIAEQVVQRPLPEGGTGMIAVPDSGNENRRPQVVKLKLSDTTEENAATVRFSANGMSLAVSEDIPVMFLAKLLEAVNHGSC